jgi:hypothetical protein
MRNYFVLTGFLIGLMISTILVGQEMVVAYENSVNIELEVKLLKFKASEAKILREARTAGLNVSTTTQL